MKNLPLSIILGSYNRFKFLKLTIDSIRQELVDMPHEIIVIDGGSDDGTLKWLLEQKDIITIVQHNRGIWQGKPIKRRSWGYFMNLGFKIAQGKYICMLSDDCLVVPSAILNGYNLFEAELAKGRNVGAMAFHWRDWGLDQDYYVNNIFNDKLYVNHGMYLSQALQAVDYIDEESFQFYTADMDVCLKIWQKGYECIAAPDSYVEHYPHANIKVRRSNNSVQHQDTKKFMNKWMEIFCDKENPKLNHVSLKKYFCDTNQTGDKFKNIDQTSPDVIIFKSKKLLANSMQNARSLIKNLLQNQVVKFLKQLRG